MSIFKKVEPGPPIEVFALNKAYLTDDHPKKVNLGIGVYRTEEGQPWVLPCVKKTEMMMAQDSGLNHEYLPVLGLEAYSKAATGLLLGESSRAILEQRAFGVQSLSGTGSLRVAAEFLANVLKFKHFYVSCPTWENHKLVFFNAGFKECHEYRYWDEKNRCLDIGGLLEDLSKAPPQSVVILHACAHNPTGCDPTKDQWKLIADCVEKNNIFVLFDSAYQGFASGDAANDAWAVRYFVDERNLEVMCAQSFAKNFGLYNERVGNLTVVVSDASVVADVKSQLTMIVRGMYSNPPNHGARIVLTVLSNPSLKDEWNGCIRVMSDRIISMRTELKDRLERLGTPGDWSHITTQIGMFSYTGLTPPQVEHLLNTYHIYMLKSGRINMCGLNMSNIDYVAKAISDTVKSIQ